MDADSPARWARRAAYLVSLCTPPSGLWRIAMGLGIPVGYSAERMSAEGYPGWGTVYTIGLAVLVQLLAFLTVGLVRPWGEVAPRWIPFMGGRRMRPRVVVAVAGTGAVLLILITLSQFVVWQMIDESTLGPGDLTGTARTVLGLCYLPLLAWGPLLAAVTYDYHRRHRLPGSRQRAG
ncbi:hypothetical protein WIS52_25835 [Pseudonocardia nematodicida]|uniref:Uncharacterized protein n=1 Tax=Pseudonocardia nematodicida TaxID=1206997 RepID=A0ABV1KHI8_9PSEU